MAQAPAFAEPIAPSDRPFTVDDWFALPEEWKYWELFEGRLCYVPAPTRTHQDAVLNIATKIKFIVERDGGYVAVAPLGVALSTGFGFEPDVVYVAPGREDILTERGIEGIPDLVIEVLSPSTRAFDQGTKLRTYLEYGVREAWLVDVEAGMVRVVWPDGERLEAAFGEAVPSKVIDIGAAGLTRSTGVAR